MFLYIHWEDILSIEISDSKIVSNGYFNPNLKVQENISFLKSETNNFILFRCLYGKKPLYYHTDESGFFISDSLINFKNRGLLKTINIGKVFEYFSDKNINYNENTMFENVYNVLPGHILTLSKTEKTYKNVFKLEKNEEITKFNSSTFNAFYQKFKNIIENGFSNKEKILTLLSGGLDTSGITSICANAKIKIELFSVECRTKFESVPEREYAQEVVDRYDLNHRTIYNPEFNLNNIIEFLMNNCEPILFIPSYAFFLDVAKYAKEIDAKVLFSGFLGDEILGKEDILFEELFQNKKFSLLKTLNDKWGNHFYWTNKLNSKLGKKTAKNWIIFLFFGTKRLKAIYNLFLIQLTKFRNHRVLKKIKKPNKSILINDIGQLLEENKQFKQYLNPLFNRNNINFLEGMYNLGLKYGYRYETPFIEKEIMQFAISSPKIENFGNGHGKFLYRNAMKNIVPEKVISRYSKTLLGKDVIVFIENLHNSTKDRFDDSHEIWKYLDKKETMKLYNSYLYNKNNTSKSIMIYKIIIFGLWIETV